MDKYTEYINELSNLLNKTKEKKNKTEIEKKQVRQRIYQVNTDIESCANNIYVLHSKLQFLKNYKKILKEIKFSILKKCFIKYLQFNFAILMVGILIFLLPEMVFNFPIFLVAEIALILGTVIGYTELYGFKTKAGKNIWR